MGPQQQIDTRALEIAVRAQSDIDNHEKKCSERYQAILEAQRSSHSERVAQRAEVSEKFGKLYGLLWRIAITIIAAQAGVAVWLARELFRFAPK